MARRPSEVPPSVVRALNNGTREAMNLAEGLALDPVQLARAATPDHAAAIATALGDERAVTKRMRIIAAVLAQRATEDELASLATHTSDTARSWAAFAIALRGPKSMPALMKAIRPFADDPHFGVREWAWMAVRDRIVAEPLEAIAALEPWTCSRSPSLRRFATEATRPRGVWCAHIRPLRQDPSPGLHLLEPLRADSEKYVQDSVANWLNDAAKDRPDWVVALTDRWLAESDRPETHRIVRRARRSLA
jgi:3-methyladenine DNA glycosylase AlkC